MRQWLSFRCADATLAAALDSGTLAIGLLIVSGGNETLSGSHGNMAAVSTRVAAAGYPVFRYDRRGVGDSEGDNSGFEGARDDLAAAVSAFRAVAPDLRRMVAFGNCDGATVLALFHEGLAIDSLVLANPWVIEEVGELPPAAAIKARYREKLMNPREWRRLARGGVNIIKLFKGLRTISVKSVENGLAVRMRQALKSIGIPTRIVLARRDATALAFADAWKGQQTTNVTISEIDTNSHSFARQSDSDALMAVLLETLQATPG